LPSPVLKALVRARDPRPDSDILLFVRNFLAVFALVAGVFFSSPGLRPQGPAPAQQAASQNQAPPTQTAPAQPPAQSPTAPTQVPPPQAKAPQATNPQIVPAPPPQPAGPVIVLDPAHGGTDPGARGANGILEKDIVLRIARVVRVELARQGYRVVMTRDGDSNPSYDARAAQVNTYHDAIFISLHVSSTGRVGTARAYYYQFPNPIAGDGESASGRPGTGPGGLLVWEEAQRSYAPVSHRLADLIQGELAQGFVNSPVSSTGVPVRELRSVAAPAVAIEISSVAVSNPNTLVDSAGPISNAVLQALVAFRTVNQSGTK